MRKGIGAVLVMFAGLSIGYASFGQGDAGSSTAQFLKLGVGARAAGMGEAFGAVADDANAFYWNPAGLGVLSGRSVSLMHALWVENITYDCASYAQTVEGIGTLGAAVQYLSYGSIQGYDDTGLENGHFNPTDTACTFSYGRNVLGVDLGVNAKFISSTIKATGTAFAFDFGSMYRIMDGQVSFGLVLQNMGGEMKFIDESAPLPFNIKVASACMLLHNWIAALDLNAPVDNNIYAALGTEYTCEMNSQLSVQGRAGYNTHNLGTGGLNGLTCGVGIVFRNYGFDYAFVPYGNLGNTTRLSFNMKF